jgi:hypothetical protein
MITIKITRTITTPYEETVNYLIKETPTEIVEESRSSYGGNVTNTVQMVKEYAPSVAKKVKTETIGLLEQNIEDETKFDLPAVIRAINGI